MIYEYQPYDPPLGGNKILSTLNQKKINYLLRIISLHVCGVQKLSKKSETCPKLPSLNNPNCLEEKRTFSLFSWSRTNSYPSIQTSMWLFLKTDHWNTKREITQGWKGHHGGRGSYKWNSFMYSIFLCLLIFCIAIISAHPNTSSMLEKGGKC